MPACPSIDLAAKRLLEGHVGKLMTITSEHCCAFPQCPPQHKLPASMLADLLLCMHSLICKVYTREPQTRTYRPCLHPAALSSTACTQPRSQAQVRGCKCTATYAPWGSISGQLSAQPCVPSAEVRPGRRTLRQERLHNPATFEIHLRLQANPPGYRAPTRDMLLSKFQLMLK